MNRELRCHATPNPPSADSQRLIGNVTPAPVRRGGKAGGHLFLRAGRPCSAPNEKRTDTEVKVVRTRRVTDLRISENPSQCHSSPPRRGLTYLCLKWCRGALARHV